MLDLTASRNKHANPSKGEHVRKFLVGAAIVVGLLGQAATADAASLRSLRRDCRDGDADACREYAYRRCLRAVRAADLDDELCDSLEP